MSSGPLVLGLEAKTIQRLGGLKLGPNTEWRWLGPDFQEEVGSFGEWAPSFSLGIVRPKCQG